MLTFEMIIVFLGLIGMVTALVLDKMRPGMILFSVTVLFLCFGILTPKEMLEGFSNKGMITVALLFLISEGVRQSGDVGTVDKETSASREDNGHEGAGTYAARYFFCFCFSQ